MDKKRNKTSRKNVIHMKRIIKAKMRECMVTGKSLEYTHLHHKYYSLQEQHS
jgi:hypothetical protein